MWLAIMSFIGGPVVKGLIDAYNIHVKAQSADLVTAANLAGKEIAAQTVEAQNLIQLRIAEIGHPWEPEKLFAYVMVIYFGKLVLWDKVIGSFLGETPNIFNTDPLKGDALVWAGMIMSFYLAKRGFENVARIISKR